MFRLPFLKELPIFNPASRLFCPTKDKPFYFISHTAAADCLISRLVRGFGAFRRTPSFVLALRKCSFATSFKSPEVIKSYKKINRAYYTRRREEINSDLAAIACMASYSLYFPESHSQETGFRLFCDVLQGLQPAVSVRLRQHRLEVAFVLIERNRENRKELGHFLYHRSSWNWLPSAPVVIIYGVEYEVNIG